MWARIISEIHSNKTQFRRRCNLIAKKLQGRAQNLESESILHSNPLFFNFLEFASAPTPLTRSSRKGLWSEGHIGSLAITDHRSFAQIVIIRTFRFQNDNLLGKIVHTAVYLVALKLPRALYTVFSTQSCPIQKFYKT
jgi:hypothetical protein